MQEGRDTSFRRAASRLAAGALLCAAVLAPTEAPRAQPDPAPTQPQPGATLRIDELERRGARIGDIDIVVQNVFNPENPDEAKALYRWANRVHVTTRESVVRSILLIGPGDALEGRLLRESARLLRGQQFMVEAEVVPTAYHEATNTVDLRVTVRDAWNLSPDLKMSRSGGENEYGLGLEDSNLFGTGKDLAVSFSSDVDREEAFIGYSDPNVRGSRVRLSVQRANRSDGDLSRLTVGRPFFALDTRWSLGSNVLADERIDPIYDLGETVEEFRHRRRDFSIEGGWSKGLIDRRATRWLFGFAYEKDEFAPTPEYPDLILLPPDRKLVYPWIGFQLIEDDFRVMTELNDMGRTEDIPLGLNLTAKLGFSSEGFGADRDATLLRVDAQKGWEPGGPGRLFLLETAGSTRREGGEQRDSIVSVGARYYHRNLENHLFSVSLIATTTHRLDAENQVLLGGDNGLRGYPLRYQTGKHQAMLTLEQRFFTNWYPWRLFRVGYAVFFDAGRVWGEDARGTPSKGMLYDIGAGLRLSSPRSSGRQVVHVDLAFPLGHDGSVDSVQFVVGTKRSF
jgi:outer membrane protein assembly factor BamA